MGEEESLGKMMARKVSREYLAYQDLRLQTAASSLARERFRLSAAQQERVQACFDAEEQRYGGTPMGWV